MASGVLRRHPVQPGLRPAVRGHARRRCWTRSTAWPPCPATPGCAAATSTPSPTPRSRRGRTRQPGAAAPQPRRRSAMRDRRTADRCPARSAEERAANPFLRIDAPGVRARTARTPGPRAGRPRRSFRRIAALEGRVPSHEVARGWRWPAAAGACWRWSATGMAAEPVGHPPPQRRQTPSSRRRHPQRPRDLPALPRRPRRSGVLHGDEQPALAAAFRHRAQAPGDAQRRRAAAVRLRRRRRARSAPAHRIRADPVRRERLQARCAQSRAARPACGR